MRQFANNKSHTSSNGAVVRTHEKSNIDINSQSKYVAAEVDYKL